MEITQEKSYKIQILRGLAIVAVVCIHNTPLGPAQVWCRPFINFGVGLFLFLSAMLSNAEKWQPKKRIVKVVIPYIIWTFIYVVISNIKNPSAIPMAYIKTLLTANSAAIMYYIFVYCEFTLLIPLIDKLARSKYKYLGFFIIPLEIIFIRLIPLVCGITINKHLAIISSVSCLGWFTYYYLGYLIGNGLVQIKVQTKNLFILWCGAIALQIAEGYWYLSMGETNCGTQIKLSSILAGSLFALLAYKFIMNKKHFEQKILFKLGEISFGIYFSHLAVMMVLNKVPYYEAFAIYPINAVLVIICTSACVYVGRKVLGKYAKYLAL